MTVEVGVIVVVKVKVDVEVGGIVVVLLWGTVVSITLGSHFNLRSEIYLFQ